MKSYTTVMYPGYGENQYWLGELDSAGQISGFQSVTLEHPALGKLTRADMLYYVVIEEEGDDLQVQCVQQYKAFPRKETRDEAITSLIEAGVLDIVYAANRILDRHRDLRRRSN